ncbi:MAG: group 1 truncated hemoglobin [Candidatus Sumerlaeia bacterium]|nr:group 1 truncated hemoglobin [Candidatus Sumerlaeia bacterium]
MPDQTLYEQLGGKKAIDAAVDLFYERILADDRIRHFFTGVDMPRQKGKQRAFLAMVFGGPVDYSGKDLRDGHAHLAGLNDTHFDAVLEHLGGTLRALGVKGELVDQVLSIAESTRSDVLQR